MTSALHGLLLTLLLVQSSSPSPPSRKVWECTGPQSKYSYLDCERDYNYSGGCYYVEHFSQFRPCAWICNDIEFNPIDEERCRAFCSAYLKQQYRPKISRATSPKLLPSHILHSNATTEVKVTRRDSKAVDNNESLSVMIQVVSVLVVGVVALAVGCFIHQRSTTKQVPRSDSKAVYCSDGETEMLQNCVTYQPEETP